MLCDFMASAGLSLVTNMVIKTYSSPIAPPTHSEVVEAGRAREKDVQQLVSAIVRGLDSV